MSSTLIEFRVVRAISQEELLLLYDATDIWRDRICYRYKLSEDQRRDASLRHADFVRGVK
jgi:hypothetical protein